MTAAVPDVAPPLTATLLAGGRSNLTFVLQDASGARWVLRRPPLHSVLPGAHDVGREYRVMAALAGTAVPVPLPVAREDNPDVLGAPFYVMAFVDGAIVRDHHAAGALDEARQRHAGQSFVDVLADLHALGPQEIGLGDLTRPTGYLERQLRGLHRQLERGRKEGGRSLPVLHEAHRRLSAAVPVETRACLLHGDYRLDNVVLAPDGAVAAVLDWELCSIGDPMADVGMLAVFWPDAEDEVVPGVATQTLAAGFPRRAEALARYADRTGADLSRLAYFTAFARWKLAVILEGVYSRFTAGAYGEMDDDSWRVFETVVPELGRQCLDTLDDDRRAP